MTGNKRLTRKDRQVFLDGMKRYQEQGIPILLDGKLVDASELEQVLRKLPDGSFYMGDFVLEEAERFSLYDAPEDHLFSAMEEQGCQVVCEMSGQYRSRGRRLKEIRFDRVYNR